MKTFDEGTLSGSSITGTPTREQDWALDQLGNWANFIVRSTGNTYIDQGREHNDANELQSFGDIGDLWAEPAHDEAGNMVAAPNPSSPTSGITLKYDAWNRLVKHYITAASTTIPVVQYEYDGLNRMIVRLYDTDWDEVIDNTRHFYYNEDWQVLVEAEGTSTITPTAMYAYHANYVDAVANRMRPSDSHVYLQDANYNVTALLEPDSTVVERYEYTPYGEVTVLDANFAVDSDGLSDVANTILYTGRWRDPNTGLQLNRNRWYHAPLGRWVSRDPIRYQAGTLNLYEYVSSRPAYFGDPIGLKCCPNGNTGCCREVPYDTTAECCEDGAIVDKVPIWVCKSSLGSDGGFRLGSYAHSYIVCEDPKTHPDTEEKYGFHPYPFDGHGGWGDEGRGAGFRPWGPGYVNRETKRDPNASGTTCTKRMVCPKEKKDKCKEGYWKPGSFDDRYNMCGWGPNCHEWANGY